MGIGSPHPSSGSITRTAEKLGLPLPPPYRTTPPPSMQPDLATDELGMPTITYDIIFITNVLLIALQSLKYFSYKKKVKLPVWPLLNEVDAFAFS